MTGTRVVWLLKFVGGFAALALLGFAVRSAALEVLAAGVPFRWGGVGVATLLLVGIYFCQIQLWRTIVGDLGYRVPYREAWQIWSFSQLGRYLPGKAWQVVGQVVLAREVGVPSRTAGIAAVLVMAFTVSTGLLVGLVFGGRAISQRWGGGGLVAAAVLAGIGLVPVIWPRVLRVGFALLRKQDSETSLPSRGALLRWFLYFSASWIAYGGAFVLFASSFGELDSAHYAQMVGAYALAHVLGLIAVFAPGGVGVREGTLGVVLGGLAGQQLPVYTVAVAARLWSIAAELVVLVGALVLRARRPKART